MLWAKIRKQNKDFSTENCHFCDEKNHSILHGRVFVMLLSTNICLLSLLRCNGGHREHCHLLLQFTDHNSYKDDNCDNIGDADSNTENGQIFGFTAVIADRLLISRPVHCVICLKKDGKQKLQPSVNIMCMFVFSDNFTINQMSSLPRGLPERKKDGNQKLQPTVNIMCMFVFWISTTSRKQVRVTNTPLHPGFV